MAIESGSYVSVDGYRGVAWYVQGREQVPVFIEDAEYYFEDEVDWVDSENWRCTMVGDDRDFHFSEDELTLLPEDDFCGGCGQIDCGHG